MQEIQKNKIKKIEFHEDHIIAINSEKQTYKIVSNPQGQSLLLSTLLNTDINVEYVKSFHWYEIFTCIMYLSGTLLTVFIFVMFFLPMSKLSSATYKNTFKADLRIKKHTFDDIAGADEAKEELKEVIDFLKNPSKFAKIGAKIPKGILLYGAPGTGKTLLAKAVASEAGCNFFYASGSQFEEVYVGLGASKLRGLFEEASKNTPSLIFIDEIDTIGGKRNKYHSHAGDQTLNELLTQLDGFNTNKGVILFAATNRIETMDSALLRPGRLGDRIICIDLPVLSQREAILKVHLKNVKVDPELIIEPTGEKSQSNVGTTVVTQTPIVEIEAENETNSEHSNSNGNQDTQKTEDLPTLQPQIIYVAKITVGFSGADLANVVNEAALIAARNADEYVTIQHLIKSVEKVQMGREKKSLKLAEKDRKRTAYHESGHAIVAKEFDEINKIHVITILPRGNALGYVGRSPEGETDTVSKTMAEMLNDIKVCFGGYAAEEIIFGKDQVTAGPRSDLQHATKIARSMVTDYGMSKLGFMNYQERNPDSDRISESCLHEIEKEINSILNNAYQEVVFLLKEKYLDVLHKLAEHLLKHEVLYADEVDSFFFKHMVKKQ